jgi:hypothetical protein
MMKSKLRVLLLILMVVAAILLAVSQLGGLLSDVAQNGIPGSSPSGGQGPATPTRPPQLKAGLPTLTFPAITLPAHVAGQLSSPIRAIRLDYVDMSDSRAEVASLEQKIISSGFNLVSLGAGRAEWTFFKWAGHENDWSDDVKESGVDFLAEDAARFSRWAYVDASVDVLSPLYIQAHPQAAAVSYDGVPSTNLVSTVQLAEGPYGKLLLEMIRTVASSYAVNSISINEMYYQRDGYGPDDKAAYLQYTGRVDWPRTASGQIDISNQSIGDWRSFELAKWIDQAHSIAHQYGKSFFVNVALNLNNSKSPVLDYGQPLDLLQAKMDKILLWGFFDPESIAPEDLTNAAQILNENDQQNKFIFVIGLWNKLNQPIAAQKLNQAIAAVQQGGIQDIWITPASLMNTDHWNTLASLWAPR